MASPILPPHHYAASLKGTVREFQVPKVWPGTFVPNLSDWREGDIVLVEAVGVWGGVIQAGQAISTKPPSRAGSGWTHAAIYVGGGEVVDATFGVGVQLRSVWNFCQNRAITLRRIGDPAIPAADISDIATVAKTYIGMPYGAFQAVLSKLGWNGAPNANPSALYCSSLVDLAVVQATQAILSAYRHCQPLYPATLASHSVLDPVLLEWRDF